MDLSGIIGRNHEETMDRTTTDRTTNRPTDLSGIIEDEVGPEAVAETGRQGGGRQKGRHHHADAQQLRAGEDAAARPRRIPRQRQGVPAPPGGVAGNTLGREGVRA